MTKKTNQELKQVKENQEINGNTKVEKIDRRSLTLQHFMSDMMAVGSQTRDSNLKKPTGFNYGDGTVTNYLLWLILAELMIANGEKV